MHVVKQKIKKESPDTGFVSCSGAFLNFVGICIVLLNFNIQVKLFHTGARFRYVGTHNGA